MADGNVMVDIDAMTHKALRVKHHEAKENSRYAFRDVHYSQVQP